MQVQPNATEASTPTPTTPDKSTTLRRLAIDESSGSCVLTVTGVRSAQMILYSFHLHLHHIVVVVVAFPPNS